MDKKSIIATYTLAEVTAQGEEVIETMAIDNPLRLITGIQMTPIAALEACLATTEIDSTYDLILPPSEAFGTRNEEYVLSLPRTIFTVNGVFDSQRIVPGAVIPLRNNSGQVLQGTVVTVNDDDVIVDMNHPLSGKTIHIYGRVVDSHLATDAEIAAVTRSGCGHRCQQDCQQGCEKSADGGCCHSCEQQ